MNTFLKYDKDRDVCYHFLNTPDLYITQDIVEEIFLTIGQPLTQNDFDVQKYIRGTELLKMQYCLGKITLEEKKEKCLNLDDEFCAKHSCWAYSCEYYQRFYAALGFEE